MTETMSFDNLLAFTNALLDPVAIADAEGRLVAINPALQTLLGYIPEETDGLDLGLLMPQHRRRQYSRELAACLRGKDVIAVPTELWDRDARRISVFLTMSPLWKEEEADPLVVLTFRKTTVGDGADGPLNLMLTSKGPAREEALARMVTALEADARERRNVENQLRLSQRQLRLLSQKAMELLESDRQYVAKELHDSIGASLAAIKFSLEGWLDVHGDRSPPPEIPFQSIIAHIVATIKETKRMSASLRPTTLDDLGLLATARCYCRNLSGRYEGIRITPCFAVREADIPERLKIVLYRVMQEALNNAAKHSGAAEIQVELGLANRHLEMTIADQGCGFDPDRIMGAGDALSGYGINIMRERVEICGGDFDLRSRIGRGTRVQVRLPLESCPSRSSH